MTPEVVQPDSEPFSKPPLTMTLPPPVVEFTVQLNVVEPEAPVVSVAVTVTDEVPAVVGVPEIRPLPLSMATPCGRPVAA